MRQIIRLIPGFSASPESRARRQQMAATIWQLRRLLEQAMGGGVARDLADGLQWVVDHADTLEKAAVAWFDLVEELVQGAERQYGTGPGRGSLKSDEVKEVFRRLLNNQQIDLPHVPAYLEPVIVDVAVDMLIDLVVLQANESGLWNTANRRPQPLGWKRRMERVLLAPFRLLFRWTRPLWDLLGRVAVKIYLAMRRPVYLSPELEARLAEVERRGLPFDLQQVATALTELVVWVGEHRDQLVAGFRLVLRATEEAERFLSLSGSEKKAYARDLVWAVLDDLGFGVREGLVYAFVNVVIEASVEAAWKIYDKRGVFR